eukprot:gene7033-11198_t
MKLNESGVTESFSIRSNQNGDHVETHEIFKKCVLDTKKCEITTKIYKTPVKEFNKGKKILTSQMVTKDVPMEDENVDIKMNDNFFNEAFGALEKMMFRPRNIKKEPRKPPQQKYKEYRASFNKIIYGEELEE